MNDYMDEKNGFFWWEQQGRKLKMNKKQIRRFSSFLVKKTNGQFHYEDDNWYGYFSKKQLKKNMKKISICMKGKNYQYFCDMLFNAFDNYFILKKKS